MTHNSHIPKPRSRNPHQGDRLTATVQYGPSNGWDLKRVRIGHPDNGRGLARDRIAIAAKQDTSRYTRYFLYPCPKAIWQPYRGQPGPF